MAKQEILFDTYITHSIVPHTGLVQLCPVPPTSHVIKQEICFGYYVINLSNVVPFQGSLMLLVPSP